MSAHDTTTDQMAPPAVVIGLDSLTGLQTARIFSERGVPVVALAKNAAHFGCWTRACPPAEIVDTESEALIMALERLGPRLPRKSVLFPCSDLSVLLVSEHRERLAPWYHLGLADHQTVLRLVDKARFVELARELQVAIPPSFILRERSDILRMAQDLTFPCVVKPALKTPLWQRHVGRKAIVVESAAQLDEIYAQLHPWCDELVVQQWIDGPVGNQFTCNGYFSSAGEPLVTFVTRKLRQWPVNTGIGCFSEESRDPEPVSQTVRLFQQAGYRGLGYLELKRDQRDGRCYVVEPNIGRPTGRAASAEAGGVELLMTAYCDALGLPLPESRTQQYTNIKWIHRRRDLQAAWSLWRRGQLSMGQWLASRRGRKVDAIFHWRDWRPFVGDLWQAFAKTYQKPAPVENLEPQSANSTSEPVSAM